MVTEVVHLSVNVFLDWCLGISVMLSFSFFCANFGAGGVSNFSFVVVYICTVFA